MEKITEDYVSFEIAKLLREKGFDEQTLYHFIDGNDIITHDSEYKLFRNSELVNAFNVPTLQMAMKWIREQGFYIKIDIDVDYDEDERGTKWYYEPAWDWVVFRIDERKQMSDDGALYATYEQAAEVAIKWCLENLI